LSIGDVFPSVYTVRRLATASRKGVAVFAILMSLKVEISGSRVSMEAVAGIYVSLCHLQVKVLDHCYHQSQAHFDPLSCDTSAGLNRYQASIWWFLSFNLTVYSIVSLLGFYKSVRTLAKTKFAAYLDR
jgi:hypothetical protein